MGSTFRPSKKTIITYLVWAFVPAYLLQGLIALLGQGVHSTAASVLLSITMWTPALAVLITKKTRGESKGIGTSFKPRFKGNIRWYLLALLLPALVFNALSAVFYFALFPSQLNTEVLQGGLLPIIIKWLGFVLLSFLIMPLTLGEEIGWRGFLFPAVRSHTSQTKAHLLCGLIWGLWHAPIIAQGYNMGTGYHFFPWLGILAMCVFTFALGTILSYMVEKTGSLWPAVLGHGANNAAASTLFMMLLRPDAPTTVFVAAVFAILPLLMAAIGILVFSSQKAKAAN